jgi:hypothetical protein
MLKLKLRTRYQFDGPADESAVGQALVAVIAWAHANGIDAEAALRKEAMRISQEIKPHSLLQVRGRLRLLK